MKKIHLFIVAACNIGLLFSQTKTFTVDFNTNAGAFKKLTGVNTGPNSAASGTAAECYKNIGVEMVRTHDYHGPCDYWGYTSFFSYAKQKFNYGFKSHIDTGYHWSTTDAQINKITSEGMSPFFRLGISFPGGGVSPASPRPRDADTTNFTTFAGICKRTAMHYTAGWNAGYTYSIPYWEVWNEPNNGASWSIASANAASSFYLMYKQVADSIKSFNPALKVGAPGTSRDAFFTAASPVFVLKPDYISRFFHYCDSANVPLDFYSFHSYNKANPYHIKLLADTISYYLNQNGFNNTELVVSEMNRISQDSLSNSPKGCPYLTSALISALDSRITKIFWYRGVDLGPLCATDVGSTANLRLSGYAYRLFNTVCDSTPFRITSTGTEVNTTNINDTTKNVMIVAGKQSTTNTVKILISNLASTYTNFSINVNNLPWGAGDKIEQTIEKVVGSGYTTSTSAPVNGSTNMVIQIPSVAKESVYLVILKKQAATGISSIETESNKLTIFPNPANSTINFSEQLENIKVYTIYGQLVLPQIKSAKSISVNELSNGIYFIHSDNAVLKFSVDH